MMPLSRLHRREATLRLPDLIPSIAIGEFGGLAHVHLLADSTLGHAWELAVPTLESIDDGEDRAETACDMLLRALPEGCSLEFFVSRTIDADACAEAHARAQPLAAEGLVQELAEQTQRGWRAAAHDGFLPEEPALNFWPRAQRIRLFYKSAPSRLLGGSGLASLAAFGHARLERRLAVDLQVLAAQFRQQVRQIEQTAAEAGLALEPLDADEYLDWVGHLLFPQPRAACPVTLPSHGLEGPGEAIAQMGEVSELAPGHFVTEVRGVRCWHAAVAMTWQGTVGPGMLAPVTDHEHGVTVCVSYQAASRVKTLFALKAQQHINRKSHLPFNEVEVEEKDESFTEAQRRMFSGESFGGVRLVVWVHGSSAEDLADRAHRVLSVLDRYLPAEIEHRIGSSLLFSALPGGRSPQTERVQCRTRRLMSADAAALVPLAGCWQGTDPQRSLAFYPSRWGTALHLDPRVCDRNPHFLVVGGSGSGKSFWVHDYLMQLHRLPDVWTCLVSIKPDYDRLARLLGQSIELTLDGDHSINPFGGEPTHDNVAMWVAVLGLMLSDGNERFAVDKEAEGLLSQCALDAARLNWDARLANPIRETLLGHVLERLERTPLGRTLAARLQPYATGPYSRLFNRPKTLDVRSRFVFFNLANIVNYPCAGAVSLCLFGHVNAIMVDPGLLGRQKVLGLDEGWALMRDRASAELIEKAFRAYRAFNGMAFAVSQLLSDFDTPLGRAVLANTATKFVLPQEQSSLAELPRYLELSRKERALIASLELRKGRYGEFLVKMQGHPSTVGRVLPDPLRYAIATTDATDSARLAALADECAGDLEAAVRVFATRYPRGRAA
jgi:conjugal transfer ATP-binding protein TraC